MSEKYGISNLLYNYRNGYIANISNGTKYDNSKIQIQVIETVKQVKD